MTRCRNPEFCGRYKKIIGIHDIKSKRILLGTVIERNICSYIHKNHHCVIWKKNRRASLLHGVEEIERKIKYVMNKINEDNLVRELVIDFLT